MCFNRYTSQHGASWDLTSLSSFIYKKNIQRWKSPVYDTSGNNLKVTTDLHILWRKVDGLNSNKKNLKIFSKWSDQMRQGHCGFRKASQLAASLLRRQLFKKQGSILRVMPYFSWQVNIFQNAWRVGKIPQLLNPHSPNQDIVVVALIKLLQSFPKTIINL